MPIWAIIPVKQLAQSKSRLATVLTDGERAELVQHLLGHELDVLRQVEAIERTVVVSSDEAVLLLAQSAGAAILRETTSQGVNVAVQQAVELAEREGVTAVLILPVDLPFLQPSDITQIIDYANRAQIGKVDMIICPDRRGTGTNALYLPPISAFAFQYGEQSFHKHLEQARQQQLSPTVLNIPRLMFDLDTADDWRTYQRLVQSVNELSF